MRARQTAVGVAAVATAAVALAWALLAAWGLITELPRVSEFDGRCSAGRHDWAIAQATLTGIGLPCWCAAAWASRWGLSLLGLRARAWWIAGWTFFAAWLVMAGLLLPEARPVPCGGAA